MERGALIWFAVGTLVIVGAIGFFAWSSSKPSALEPLAQCLKDRGAVFYGAFWCPHCQATKRMFGTSAKSLPYVECSTPDGKAQLQICIDKAVTNYPTWEFADGTRLTGERTAQELATASGCTLPS